MTSIQFMLAWRVMPDGTFPALATSSSAPRLDRLSVATAAAIAAALLVTYFYLAATPLNHDVAWLLTATQRWVAGNKLYVDIIEINPPLIFLETVALTGGLLSKQAYLAGVIACVGISAAAVMAQRGPRLSVFSAVAMIAAGITDFGQRDHLALIFLMPFLLVVPSSKARAAFIGAWAFLGVGLKPHFVLIPAAYVAARCWQKRSLSPAFESQNLVLLALCISWLAIAAIFWPVYFTVIIPLAGFVYHAFGFQPSPQHFAVSAILTMALILVARRQPDLVPLAFAAAGAIAEFFLQGRFWSYQFVPALGLTMLVCLQAGFRESGIFRLALLATAAVLTAWPLQIGPNRYRPSIIPVGVKSVVFLTERVAATYPEVTECGVTNTSRYPSFWTLPGAWNQLGKRTEDRAKAKAFLQREFATISNDIRTGRPEIIFEDSRPTYFGTKPFSYSQWLDLSDYRIVGMRDRYRTWLRSDIDASVMERPTCTIRGVRTGR